MRLRVILPLSFIGLAACGAADPEVTPSEALDADAARVFTLSQACAGCHSEVSSAMVSLADYDHNALLASLTTYQSDPEGTTVMHRLMRGYSEEEIELISAYLGQSGATP